MLQQHTHMDRMKKLIPLMALLFLLPIVSAAELAFDGFESGTFTGGTGWINGWSNVGTVAIRGWSDPYEGNRHAWLRGVGASMSRQVTINDSDVTVSLAAKLNNLASGNNARLIINDVLIKEWTVTDSDNVWKLYSFNITGLTTPLTLRLEANMNNLGQEFHVDNIRVSEGEGEGEIPSSGRELYEAGENYYVEVLPGGVYRVVVGDSITYYDGEQYLPVWRNIYNLSLYEFENYDLGVETLKYNAYFKRVGRNAPLVSFVSNDTKVYYQPQVIGWINVWDGRENIALPQTSNSTIHENKITYPDIYGPGISVSYVAYGNYIRKEITINNRSDLTPPSEFALGQGPVVFYAEYLLTISNVTGFIVNNESWDFETPIETAEDILILNNASGVIFKIKKPYVLDAEGMVFPATYRLIFQDSSLRIRLIVPYETLWNEAVYPINIDPTTGYDDGNMSTVIIDLANETFNPLEKIILYNVSSEGTVELITKNTDGNLSVDYAINPLIDFESGIVVTKNSTGDYLLKCPSWNFTGEYCGDCIAWENDTCVDTDNDKWIYLQDIIPGESYNFTITPVDPAYIEINSSGQSTTTSTTPQNKTSLNINDLEMTTPYAIFSSRSVTNSDTGSNSYTDTLIDGVVTSAIYEEAKDSLTSNHYPNRGVMWVGNLSAGNHSATIRYNSQSGGVTTSIRNAWLIGMKLPYTASFLQSTANVVYSTGLEKRSEMNFSVSEAQPYWIYASSISESEGTAVINLRVDNISYSNAGLTSKDARDYVHFSAQKVINLSTGNHSASIWASSTTTGSDWIRDFNFLALPLNPHNYFYNETVAETSISATSYVNFTTLTFNVTEPGKYLITSSSMATKGSTFASIFVNLMIDGVQYCEGIREPNNAADFYPFGCVVSVNLTSGVHTANIQSRISGFFAGTIRQGSIMVLGYEDKDYCLPPLDQDWIIDTPIICDGVTRTTGTGRINITSTGSLELRNSANITSKGYNLERGSMTWKIMIQRLSKLIITR